MNSRFRTAKKGAYVVHLPDLEKLWTLMETRVGNVSFEAECADEVQREFNCWEDLESYENAPSKQIVEMSLSARSHDFQRSVSIDLSPESDFALRVTIHCPDDDMSPIKDKTIDILDGMRHRILSFIVGRDYLLAIMRLSWSLAIAMIIVNFISYGTIVIPDVESGTVWKTLLLAYYAFLILVGIGYAISKLRAILIPTVYFAIGQGKARYEAWKSRWLWALSGSGVVIGILVSIVS